MGSRNQREKKIKGKTKTKKSTVGRKQEGNKWWKKSNRLDGNIFIVFVILVGSSINPDNKNKNFKINYIENYVKSEKNNRTTKKKREGKRKKNNLIWNLEGLVPSILIWHLIGFETMDTCTYFVISFHRWNSMWWSNHEEGVL